MNALPFLEKVVVALSRLGNEPLRVGALDAGVGHDLEIAAGLQQVDFRLSRSGDVNMSRFVIGCVDDEPEAVAR